MRTPLFGLWMTIAVMVSASPANARFDFPTIGDRGDTQDAGISQDRDKCPAGSYLVGMQVRFGLWIDSVTLKCASLNPDGSLKTLTRLPKRGGGGGGPFTGPDQCAPGFIANGIRFTLTKNDRQVRKFILECRPVKGGDPVEVSVGVNSDTQSPHDQICPIHQVAIGMHINAGLHVNAAGLMCDTEPVRTIPSQSEARKFAKCDAYARAAVMQSAEYVGRNCRTSNDNPDRWGGNYQGHYDWCSTMTASNPLPDNERRYRDKTLQTCRIIRSWLGGLASLPACTASVTLRNRACTNLDGTPSTILPSGSLSVVGCGGSDAQALQAAKARFASQAAIADQPTNGACTYDAQHVNGCLCR